MNGTPAYPLPAPADAKVFQGRTVDQWAERMESQNPTARSQASAALGSMGESGYPFLLKGLRSNSDDVRMNSLQNMTKPVMVAHQQETLGLLRSMLGDPNPLIRQGAAARVSWYGKDAQVALPAVQALAQNDSEPEVRRVAAIAVTEIMDHLVRGGRMDRGVKEPAGK
jgi:HEAT repeat protein